MSDFDPTNILGEWEGYDVESVQRLPRRKGTARIRIELHPREDRPGRCSGCGRRVASVHDTTVRVVRDLPILDAETQLVVPRRRLACPRCGPKLERLSWLSPWGRVTARLAESVARMCQHMAVKHVAQYFHLSWDRVKGIDKRWLRKTLGPVDLRGVEVIAMDEFAIQKGHRYATVIVDAITKRVLWVGRGRGREDIRPFFELLGPEGRPRIKAVAMDMNAGYLEEVRHNVPKPRSSTTCSTSWPATATRSSIGYGSMRQIGCARSEGARRGEGITLVAAAQPKQYRQAGRPHPTAGTTGANRKLAKVYMLKDDLKHLWDYHYRGAALRFWNQWYRRAVRSRIAPLVRFARNLKAHLATILAHCQWRLTPACWRESTTRSRSSNAWPTASATMTTSS